MIPVCVKCCLEMTCKKNGVWFVKKDDVARRGDRWSCNNCGNQVIIGFGRPVYYYEDQWNPIMALIAEGIDEAVFCNK